jgi:5-formyltetrahydrofolate cyclo-ligase
MPRTFRNPRGVGLTKKKIRSKLLLRLKIQKEEKKKQKSEAIKKKLFRTEVFKRAKTVMFYIAFDGEVDTQEMIKEAHKLGKKVVVPICHKDRTIWPCILKEKARLKKGFYGISEPTDKKSVSLKAIDLVLVPGVAFDKKGNRLGRGKGYYDRFLKRIPENRPSIGLAFDFQILPFVPTTNLDVSVKKIISA